jgi:hypothetical protein
VQQHVRHAQHVWELLLLDRTQRALHPLLVSDGLHVALAHVADRARQESTRSARRIEQNLARMRIDAIGHERRDCPRGVVLAGVPRALEIVENLLVDLAEVLLFREVVEVDVVDLVDDLPHQLTRLHVVVRILEDVADDASAIAGTIGWKIFQRREELVVDEGVERVAGHAFGIRGQARH